jgi:4-amino-4-deoxy-L-arabinose transferase-like glycosyltransferase
MVGSLGRLRTAAIVGLLGIAVTHVGELGDKLEESAVRYQAYLFIALIVGCIALALMARHTPERPWWTGVLAVSVLPFVAFIVSRTVGLPGGEDDIGAWSEPAGIASLLFEAFTAIVAVRALSLIGTARQRVFARRPAQQPRRRAELIRES